MASAESFRLMPGFAAGQPGRPAPWWCGIGAQWTTWPRERGPCWGTGLSGAAVTRPQRSRSKGCPGRSPWACPTVSALIFAFCPCCCLGRSTSCCCQAWWVVGVIWSLRPDALAWAVSWPCAAPTPELPVGHGFALGQPDDVVRAESALRSASRSQPDLAGAAAPARCQP